MRYAIFAVALSGCFGAGDGVGSVTGALFIQQCTHEADLGSRTALAKYDMQPHFFVADAIQDLAATRNPYNKLSIRVQPSGTRIEESDVLYLNVGSVRDIAATMGQPLTIGPVTNMRATLSMNETCPFRAVSAELDGTLTFTSFGQATAGVAPTEDFHIDFGDHLLANFSFNLIDRRAVALGGVGDVPTDPSVLGQINGTFDFIVRQGRTAQAYQ